MYNLHTFTPYQLRTISTAPPSNAATVAPLRAAQFAAIPATVPLTIPADLLRYILAMVPEDVANEIICYATDEHSASTAPRISWNQHKAGI